MIFYISVVSVETFSLPFLILLHPLFFFLSLPKVCQFYLLKEPVLSFTDLSYCVFSLSLTSAIICYFLLSTMLGLRLSLL